jgi:glycosyltransferase involved in cell wall biosynthesis
MDNFNTITLIHNQADNLPRILSAYASQTRLPDTFIFVLDRCNDNSENILDEFSKQFKSKIITNNNGTGFLAGYCRDLVYTQYNDLPVIFLDGDCIPSPELFAQFSEAFCNNIVIGSRKLETKQGILDDRRTLIPWAKDYIFSPDELKEIDYTFLAKNGLLTISCCLGVSPSICRKIKEINQKLYGVDRLFAPIFDGQYGGEDEFFGLTAMLWELPIVSIPTKHYVLHVEHANTTIDYEAKVTEQYTKLVDLADKLNAPGKYNIDFDYNMFVIDSIKNKLNKNRSYFWR